MGTSSQLNIKGMVCNRCISTIQEIFHQKGYELLSVSLGKVVFNHPLSFCEINTIRDSISVLGFELLEDQNERLLDEIKSSLRELVILNSEGIKNHSISNYLVQKFNRNYHSLSDFFKRYEGITIEKFYINSRIDKVKELLVYSDLTLSEIAFKLGFNSPFHLSNQFKLVIGQTPSDFRSIRKVNIENHVTDC